MTQLLEQALADLRKLPDPEQDAIASLILEQIADDDAWNRSFAHSQDPLARLAAEARSHIAAGRVRKLNPRQTGV